MQQSLFFTGPRGENLAASLHRPEVPEREAVILGHCFTCSRHTGVLRAIAQRLCDEGFMALRFDFSGNGQSGGDFAARRHKPENTDLLIVPGADHMFSQAHHRDRVAEDVSRWFSRMRPSKPRSRSA
jgi:alpha/beta superfamily hydrolase